MNFTYKPSYDPETKTEYKGELKEPKICEDLVKYPRQVFSRLLYQNLIEGDRFKYF